MDEQKKKLEQQLWAIANDLRGKMHADEFRDYALGFIFYKFLSERLHLYANRILEQDGIDFLSIREGTEEGQQYLDAIAEASIDALGYFLKPSELFSEVAKRGSKPGQFILSDLSTLLNNIQKSTMGEESEDDFDNLFEGLDLTSSKLGRTEEAKNTLITKILVNRDQIDFELEKSDSDVQGDAYEYLIGQVVSEEPSTGVLLTNIRCRGTSPEFHQKWRQPQTSNGSAFLLTSRRDWQPDAFYGSSNQLESRASERPC